jgi:hypothetical protein
MPQVASTQCNVEIVTPDNVRLVFTTDQAVSDLLHVETHNDMAEACGAFTLTFTPRRIEGRTYDQLIPLRSLVTIRFQDREQPVSEADAVVMVGLTEDHSVSEDWSRAQPQRVVLVQGRSIAAILLDATLFYHPRLENAGATLSGIEGDSKLFWQSQLLIANVDPRTAIATILQYFLGTGTATTSPARGSNEAILTQEQVVSLLMARMPGLTREQALARLRQEQAAQQPSVPPAVVAPPVRSGNVAALEFNQAVTDFRRRHPGVTLEDAQIQVDQMLAARQEAAALPLPGHVTQAQPAPPPQTGGHRLINLQLPHLDLPDVLVINNAAWTLFDPGATFSMASNPPMVGSVWNYVQMFVDRLFQEFFTRMEDGVCKIFFRGKPFLQDALSVGTRFRQDDPTCQTLDLDQATLVHSTVRRQSANVYNTFMVLSRFVSTMAGHPGMKYLIPPLQLTDPAHPSYVGKYGIRLLEHLTPYLSAPTTSPLTPPGQNQDGLAALAERWQGIAAAWYGSAPDLYAGMLTVLGSPRWNVGHRLLTEDDRGQREWYCEGVSHQYDFHTGRYLTQLRVTRGWYLDGPVDTRHAG